MNVYMYKYVQHVYMNMLSLSFLQDDLPNLRTNVLWVHTDQCQLGPFWKIYLFKQYF